MRKCARCKREIQSSQTGLGRPRKYCTARCARLAFSEEYRKKHPQRTISTGTIGVISEYKVIADMLLKGYEVFHAASPNCSCDLALLKDDKLLKIEVTTGRYLNSGEVTYCKHERNSFDIIAVVLPDSIIYYPPLT